MPVALRMMLRRHWVLLLSARLKDTRRLGRQQLAAAGPQCLRTIVQMIARGPFNHHVENCGTSHYLNCLLEGQIRERVTVAPHYHIARLKTGGSRRTAFSCSLLIVFVINNFFFVCHFIKRFGKIFLR